MKSILRNPLLLALAVGVTLSSRPTAAVPPPEQLLPADTLAVLTAPDWGNLVATRKTTAALQFWDDPAMRPFRDKLANKLTKEVLDPLEQQLGVKLADYGDLPQGQFTLAITQNGWSGGEDPVPGFLLILDSRDKSEQLKKNLADVRKKLADSGNKLKVDKIRDVEFTTLLINPEEIGKAIQKAAEGKDKAGADKKETDKSGGDAKPGPYPGVMFAQVDALLLVGTSAKDLEKVLIRLSGGSAPTLAEHPAFEANSKAYFREAQLYGWIHLAPLLEIVTKVATEASAKDGNANAAAPKPDKIINALGLSGLKTLAFAVKNSAEGEAADFFIGVPDDKRKGLLKLIHTDAKDAGPPAFVPADSVQFSRWRLDGQKFWATIEATVNEISPGILGFVLAQVEAGIKEKDPNFSITKNLIGNLGDDLITYQKGPRGKTIEDWISAPSIFLLGSPNPEQFIQTIKSLLVMLPGGSGLGELKDREFLGRKIYSIALPAMPGVGGKPREQSLQICGTGGYVALTTDSAILEEYLRASETKAKPLSETPGLADAAQKVGGMATGLFAFSNNAEMIKSAFEALKSDPNILVKLLAANPLAAQLNAADLDKKLQEWVDFSLLPSYDQVAKYFGISVASGKVTGEGYLLKSWAPRPPQLK